MSWSKKEIPTSQFCNVVNRRIDLERPLVVTIKYSLS